MSGVSLLVRWFDPRRQPWRAGHSVIYSLLDRRKRIGIATLGPREKRGVRRGRCVGGLAPGTMVRSEASAVGSRVQRDRLAPRSSQLNRCCHTPTKRKEGGEEGR